MISVPIGSRKIIRLKDEENTKAYKRIRKNYARQESYEKLLKELPFLKQRIHKPPTN